MNMQGAEAIRDVIREWREAVNAGDVDRVLRVAADDVEIMPPGQAAMSGASAREFLRGFLTSFHAEVQPYTGEEIIVFGEWAVQRYTYALTLTPKAGGEPFMQRGDGVHLFRRDATGAWRIAKDVFTAVSPAAAGA